MEEGAKKKDESELNDAIITFEQILEAIPTDRLALETLSDAYEQLGDIVKALDYYVRLGAVLLSEDDKAATPHVLEKLQSLGAKDTAAQKMAEKLSRLVTPDEAELSEELAETKKRVGAFRRTADITAELALAWNLVQAGELTQDEYSSVVNDLTESSSRINQVPVTVLHVLRDRTFNNYEKILSFLSQNSGLPIIPLASFELQKDANSLLSEDIMVHRGAIVYELMGKDALVAILNPYDTELRKEVESITNRTCHFYIVGADDYDKYLYLMKKSAEGDAQSVS